MEQDLRELFKKQREDQHFQMKADHENRFLDRLEKELPIKKNSTTDFRWFGIAASVVFLVVISVFFFKKEPVNGDEITVVQQTDEQPVKQTIGLGDLSPDLQKIETYYVANINLALSKLEISDDNKELVDGYLERLEELNKEYETLSKELNEIGPNDQTIAAMVQNLQLRAQLLQKLNEKLNQLKSSKNEQITVI